MRAPGSGTAGRSARAGLVLLQSSAFRNAYIIQLLLGGGVDLGVPIGFQHFPGLQLFGGRKDPRHLCFVVIMVVVGAQVCLLCESFFFFLGHYCKGHGWRVQVHNLPAFISASSPVIT